MVLENSTEKQKGDTMQALYNRRRELKRAVKEVEKQIRETENKTEKSESVGAGIRPFIQAKCGKQICHVRSRLLDEVCK